jgi:hypothetical protein
MKRKSIMGIGLLLLSSVSGNVAFAVMEDFKGPAPTHEFVGSFMTGFGLIDTNGGVPIVGSLSKKILNEGWLSDVTDQVFFEVSIAPIFLAGTSAFMYSTHLRWDFVRNDQWTYYALGGLAGNDTGRSLGDRFAIHPRFGLGAFFRPERSAITWRAEVSHEWIIGGVAFPF